MSKFVCNEKEKDELRQLFPKILISHIKTDVEYYMCIPYGKKYFIWVTTYKNQKTCILLEIVINNKINNIHIINCEFHESLSQGQGTIFYGTFFNNRFFSMENVYFYKGQCCSSLLFSKKMEIYLDIFKKELITQSNDIILGLPIINNSYNDIIKVISLLPYKCMILTLKKNVLPQPIYSKIIETPPILTIPPYIPNLYIPKPPPPFLSYSQPKFDFKTNSFSFSSQTPIVNNNVNNNINNNINNVNKYNTKSSSIEKVFKITAEIQNDIYIITNGTIIDYAHIPDYNTSVMMNKLFRNIKENENLDALEESDDEDFENNNEDKYVYLDKQYNMLCRFNNKFKKWVPIKVV